MGDCCSVFFTVAACDAKLAENILETDPESMDMVMARFEVEQVEDGAEELRARLREAGIPYKGHRGDTWDHAPMAFAFDGTREITTDCTRDGDLYVKADFTGSLDPGHQAGYFAFVNHRCDALAAMTARSATARSATARNAAAAATPAE